MAVHSVATVGACRVEFDGDVRKATVSTVVVTMPDGAYRVECGAEQWTISGAHVRANNTPPAMAVRPASS